MIGTYVEPTTKVYTQSYETASWYSKHRIEKGTSGEVKFDGYWFYVNLPATTIETFFVNRLFTASSIQHEVDISKPSTFGFQWDGYGLASAVERGLVELSDEWEVKKVGEYSTGEPMMKVVRT